MQYEKQRELGRFARLRRVVNLPRQTHLVAREDQFLSERRGYCKV
jgi:hypothetical protein